MSSKLYALLLHIYPKSFRREHGFAMQQLFNDQRRAARGLGGFALLRLKTLRDCVISVPAAYENERRASRSSLSKGAVLAWTVIVLLGLTFLRNGASYVPAGGAAPNAVEAALVAADELGPIAEPGEYRAVVRVGLAIVSTLLAIGAFRSL